jgi:hypothetical protein
MTLISNSPMKNVASSLEVASGSGRVRLYVEHHRRKIRARSSFAAGWDFDVA